MNRFDEFLKSGVLGPVRVGVYQTDIRRALGDPEDVINPAIARWPHGGWFYGGMFLQIFLEYGRVSGFGLYFWHPSRLPAAVGVDAIPFAESSSMSDVAAYLDERTIGYRYDGPEGEPVDRLVVAEATIVIFDDDGSLQKILTQT